MQEGILSLMQLPKTVGAVEEMSDAGRPADLRHRAPDHGGLLASFASLGDVRLAEPGALISFTGPRVVHRRRARSFPTTSASPSRTSASGTSTRSSARSELRPVLARLLALSSAWRKMREPTTPRRLAQPLRDRLAKLAASPLLRGARRSARDRAAQRQLERIHAGRHGRGDLALRRARAPRRAPVHARLRRAASSTTSSSCTATGRADDDAIVAGLGKLDGRTIALIGHQKGRDVEGATHRHFGMAYPEGYRKAMRVMELADRHGFRSSRSSTRRVPIRASRPSSTARAARSPARRR